MAERRPADRTSFADCSASAFDRAYEKATSTPRRESSRATTAPMRLPPVMSATLLVRSTGGRAGAAGEGGGGGGGVCPAHPVLPARPARSVTKRAEERRALVRIAPLRPERRAGEEMLIGNADGRVVDGSERMEPELRAAGRIVREMLVDFQ